MALANRTKTKRKVGSLSETSYVRILKVAGLVLGAFAVFSLIAVVSYLFTWRADQSLFSNPEMMSQATGVANWGGKLGFRWAHFLVKRCFGLGSFALIILFFVLAVKLFIRKNQWNLVKATVLTISAAIISSVILAYCVFLSGGDLHFGGGLGGDCGALTAAWLCNVMGKIATGLVLVIFVVLWLLYASGSFTRWFVSLGESESANKKSSAREPEKVDTDNVARNKGDDVEDDDDDRVEQQDDTPEETLPVHTVGTNGNSGTWQTDKNPVEDEKIVVVDGPQMSTKVKEELPRIDVKEELSNYKFPSLDLLDDYKSSLHEVPQSELERNSNKIRVTLRNYNIEVEPEVEALRGPTVTLYRVKPAPGVKISAIKNLEADIAMALSSGTSGVRVVILEDAVGIEVPNTTPSIVPLKSLLNSDTFRRKSGEYDLPVAIGHTVNQKTKVFDLADAPHLLIAGATKQGKSVGLNAIITSLLYTKHPSELKFVFIDPKMVEFNDYAKLLKHYLAVLPTAANEEEEKANAIVKQQKTADGILRSLCVEMDERYHLMSIANVNNVKSYNDKYSNRHLLPTDGHRHLPYLVVVVDEYADLTMSGMGADAKKLSNGISASITRLAQKGRAAGIHVIIATQRPTVNIITGTIKANFPTRIAFRVFSKTDSQAILDTVGADKLIGRGDMLFYAGAELERMQCAMVSLEEIGRITSFIADQTAYRQCYNTPYYLPMPEDSSMDDGGSLTDMQDLDEKFVEAAEDVVRNQKGSTSSLQRHLGLGFARAGKIMDQLEAAGIVGPQDGSKARQVLVPDLSTLKTIIEAYNVKMKA